MSSSLSKDLHARHYTYNRKEKSLGLLCQNFLALYNREGVASVGLDEAASRLGVERRRIYDIVNVLESVGVLARKAKNQYSWKGFGGIPQALARLRIGWLTSEPCLVSLLRFCHTNLADGFFMDEAIRETSNSTLPIVSDEARISDDEEDDNSSNPNSQEFPLKCSPSSVLLAPATSNTSSTKIKSERRREKSLGLLTHNFVKLFLSSKAEIVSLEEAAVLLLGEAHDSLQLRSTKVRRLYDIANVLSSMNLIEKTHHSVTRKPAFRWLGVDGKSENNPSAIFSDIPKRDIKKREFGTELCPNTDIDAKRRKLFSGFHTLKPRRENVVNLEVSDDKPRKQSQQQQYCQKYEQQKENISSKGFVYGPFSPVCVAQNNAESSSKGAQDWDALAASFLPQYKNQALNDLFSHYLEAWQSWYAQVASGVADRSHPHSS